LTFVALPGNPDGALCEAAKKEDGGATTAAAEGVGDADGVVDGLAKGDPKTDVGFPELPLAPNAELAPKLPFPKTFGVVLRFANAEASGGTEAEAEGVAVSGAAGMEDPKAEKGAGAGDVPKTEVDDELAPSMTEGEGLTPKLLVSHSVALGFNGWGWCRDSEGSSGSSIIGWSSRRKASSSSLTFCSASVAPTSSSVSTPSIISGMEMPSRIASISSIVSLPNRRSRMQATR
jgi:hypothetical protein